MGIVYISIEELIICVKLSKKCRQLRNYLYNYLCKNNIKSYVLYSMYKSYNLIYRNSSIIKNNWHYKEFVSCIVDYFFIIY